MTVSTSAMNLATYAQMSNNPMVMAITDSLIDYGNVAQDLPLITKPSLNVVGSRWEGNLPSVTWRKLNSGGTTTVGTPTPWSEQAFILTNYIDTDKYLVLDQNQIGNVRANQVQAYLKAQTYDWNDKFFNNDHTSGDSNAPIGIKYRINNGPTYGVRAENKIDAGGVDMSQSGMTAATANTLLEYIDQLLWSVDSDSDGTGVVLYMNDVFKRRFHRALRTLGTQGGLDTSKDQFNRTITTYKNAIIRDPGVKADQSTRIIKGNGLSGSNAIGETSAGVDSTGASAVYTSIYAVNMGEDHFFGWQFAPINVQDLGLLQADGAVYRTLIDWAVGLANASTRSLARLYNIKIA
jgi:hypothetical protein